MTPSMDMCSCEVTEDDTLDTIIIDTILRICGIAAIVVIAVLSIFIIYRIFSRRKKRSSTIKTAAAIDATEEKKPMRKRSNKDLYLIGILSIILFYLIIMDPYLGSLIRSILPSVKIEAPKIDIAVPSVSQYLPDKHEVEEWSYMLFYIITGTLLTAAAGYGFMRWHIFMLEVWDKVDALEGGILETIRLMQISDPKSTRKRADIYENTVERFAVKGATAIAESRPYVLVEELKEWPLLTDVAVKMADRYAAESANFRFFRHTGVVGAVVITLHLFKTGNLQAARHELIDYMKKQADEFSQKGSATLPNHTHYKLFFDMSLETPTQDDIRIERQKNISFRQWFVHTIALTRGKRRILSTLEYYPIPGDGESEIVIKGTNVLLAMRRFLHTTSGYKESLSS